MNTSSVGVGWVVWGDVVLWRRLFLPGLFYLADAIELGITVLQVGQ
ncbi:hypothetical protein LLS47_06770 [Rouxiella badensis]|jgi:hypothetical protein|nr:hypothetical protein [Rouxiella badensis]MCC3717633.1 hypothetical protein [Rouxiella badensis]MCC3727423.1 hypothetical protein [Rouxiella badensis]MCC3732631.1 hypothetical protein [Rouxiella badensis]MCC3738977.1 hypothetical protein [Rouxiella badensis]MCC3758477.1 hypothetical protein [Rouxiella badensis]